MIETNYDLNDNHFRSSLVTRCKNNVDTAVAIILAYNALDGNNDFQLLFVPDFATDIGREFFEIGVNVRSMEFQLALDAKHFLRTSDWEPDHGHPLSGYDDVEQPGTYFDVVVYTGDSSKLLADEQEAIIKNYQIKSKFSEKILFLGITEQKKFDTRVIDILTRFFENT